MAETGLRAPSSSKAASAWAKRSAFWSRAHSCRRACRPHPAGRQRVRRLYGAGPRQGRRRGDRRCAPRRRWRRLLRRAGEGAWKHSPARSPPTSPSRTIGIGASPACDGQILVVDDMLGLFTDFRPKFVKRYAEFGHAAAEAVAAYAEDVRQRRFPAPEHVFAEDLARKRSPDGQCRSFAPSRRLRQTVAGWRARTFRRPRAHHGRAA